MTGTSPPCFIVGTGRCGSTLLSRMVGLHPDVLAIHEFFTGLDWSRRFDTAPYDGAALTDLLLAPQPVANQVLQLGYTANEITYPFGTPDARFQPGDDMPWLLVTMLGRLSPHPDHLCDELEAWCRARPADLLVDHYTDLFAWLTERFGCQAWVERSGSSIEYVGELHRLFPNARVVHIHRNPLETVLSLQAHPFFRLAIAILSDLFPQGVDEETAIRYVVENPPPLRAVGNYWLNQVEKGMAGLEALPPDHVHTVRFEDLLAHPADQLESVARFLEIHPEPEWILAASQLSNGPTRSRSSELTTDQLAELADSVERGRPQLPIG